MKNFCSMAITFSAMMISGFLLVSCAQPAGKSAHVQQNTPKVDTQQEENAIRATDAAWVKAVQSKNAAASASFYAPDGTLLAPGGAMASGTGAIQNAWAGLMGMPGFALTFEPTKIDVSPSGDFAYELGDYELTTKNKRGKPQTVKAKYVVVWGKQADGSWKALVDAPTTTH